MSVIDIIFAIIVVVMSVVVHEVSHGLVADKLGDPTARLRGRLTLNPLKHLDPIGSVIIPVILAVISPRFIIGWAKPVPYDPRNISHKYGDALVAMAGPLANILVALVFGILIHINPAFGVNADGVALLPYTIVIINIGLALFNLIPLPPLDGSKILFSVLPARMKKIERFFEEQIFIGFLILIFIISPLLSPAIVFLTHLVTGI